MTPAIATFRFVEAIPSNALGFKAQVSIARNELRLWLKTDLHSITRCDDHVITTCAQK